MLLCKIKGVTATEALSSFKNLKINSILQFWAEMKTLKKGKIFIKCTRFSYFHE